MFLEMWATTSLELPREIFLMQFMRLSQHTKLKSYHYNKFPRRFLFMLKCESYWTRKRRPTVREGWPTETGITGSKKVS